MANNQVNLHKNIENLSVFSGICSRLVRIHWHLQPARDCFSKSYILNAKSRRDVLRIHPAAKRSVHHAYSPPTAVRIPGNLFFSSQISCSKLLKSRLQLSREIIAFEALDARFGHVQPYELSTTWYWFCYLFLYMSEWVQGPYLLRSEKFK